MIATTLQEITSDLRRFGKDRWIRVHDLVGTHHELRVSAVVAIGHVETNLRNEAGDGGHGRGWLQVDDRFFQRFLRSSAGCRSGSWWSSLRHNALEPGYCPTLEAAVHHALSELHDDYLFARAHGFDEHAYRFMLSAYNAGATGALNGWRLARDTDLMTATGDYARRVIERRDAMFKLARDWGWPT